MRQVGYLHGLYRDARSTKHKIPCNYLGFLPVFVPSYYHKRPSLQVGLLGSSLFPGMSKTTKEVLYKLFFQQVDQDTEVLTLEFHSLEIKFLFLE